MKLATFLLITATLFSQNLFAGIGGSGGGVSAAAIDDVNSPTGYVTQICDETERGVIRSCRTIYFRPKSGKTPKAQPKRPCNDHNDSGCNYQPDNKVNELSSRIDQWFANQGYEQSPDSQNDNQPGFNDNHNN